MSHQVPSLTLEERLFIFTKVYHSILQYYAHWVDADIQATDLDERYKQFLPRILHESDRRSFALVMAEFIAPLNNGHTGYNDDEVNGLLAPIGFRLRLHSGEWVVYQSVLPEISPGDAIYSINGSTIDDWYEETKKFTCMKNETARTQDFQRWLRYVITDPHLKLVWKDSLGTVQESKLERGDIPSYSQDLSTQGKWLREGVVGYIKINAFHETSFEARAIEFLEQFKDASALVVDVRGNGGGSTPVKLIQKLMNKPWRSSLNATNLKMSLFTFYDQHGYFDGTFYDPQIVLRSRTEQPLSDAYNGKLIVLFDRHTASAAEDFVIPFKDNARAVLLGEPSYGSTGQPFFYDFGNGITFRVSTKRDSFPDGSVFEGKGITPDETLEMTREDYYSDRDPVLQRALEIALR